MGYLGRTPPPPASRRRPDGLGALQLRAPGCPGRPCGWSRAPVGSLGSGRGRGGAQGRGQGGAGLGAGAGFGAGGGTAPAQAWPACLTLQLVIWLRHGCYPGLDHPGLPPEPGTYLCWAPEALGCLATLLRPSRGAPTLLHMQGGWSPHPALQEAPSFPGLSSPLPEGPSIKHKPEKKIPETKL